MADTAKVEVSDQSVSIAITGEGIGIEQVESDNVIVSLSSVASGDVEVNSPDTETITMIDLTNTPTDISIDSAEYDVSVEDVAIDISMNNAPIEVSISSAGITRVETRTIETGGDTRTVTLAESVGAGRAVTNDGYAVDGSDMTSVQQYGGIILSAGVAGDSLVVEHSGSRLEFNSWNFTPDTPVYISNTGALTQILNDGHPYFVVGYAATTNALDLNPSVIIQRG